MRVLLQNTSLVRGKGGAEGTAEGEKDAVGVHHKKKPHPKKRKNLSNSYTDAFLLSRGEKKRKKGGKIHFRLGKSTSILCGEYIFFSSDGLRIRMKSSLGWGRKKKSRKEEKTFRLSGKAHQHVRAS